MPGPIGRARRQPSVMPMWRRCSTTVARSGRLPPAALRSRFLAFAHDDGWYLKLLYAAWGDVAALLAGAIPPALGALDLDALERAGDGYWLQDGAVQVELKTHDIDSVLNRRL